MRDFDALIRSWHSRLARWVERQPISGSPGLAAVADEVGELLEKAGFSLAWWPHREGDLLVARRPSPGATRLALYHHVDVVPHKDRRCTVREGRVFGRGVADNLGPLALRLGVVERWGTHDADVTFVIEPGEETGSRALGAWLDAGGKVEGDVWLDETGYFDEDGTQRVLVEHPDARAEALVAACEAIAQAAGRRTRTEQRKLRRVLLGGDAVERLFGTTPYLALGPNDPQGGVHGDHESLPLDTLDLSAKQFEALLAACGATPSR